MYVTLLLSWVEATGSIDSVDIKCWHTYSKHSNEYIAILIQNAFAINFVYIYCTSSSCTLTHYFDGVNEVTSCAKDAWQIFCQCLAFFSHWSSNRIIEERGEKQTAFLSLEWFRLTEGELWNIESSTSVRQHFPSTLVNALTPKDIFGCFLFYVKGTYVSNSFKWILFFLSTLLVLLQLYLPHFAWKKCFLQENRKEEKKGRKYFLILWKDVHVIKTEWSCAIVGMFSFCCCACTRCLYCVRSFRRVHFSIGFWPVFNNIFTVLLSCEYNAV